MDEMNTQIESENAFSNGWNVYTIFALYIHPQSNN